MDWTPTTLWAIAAGLAVALELLTGTFYLLMLAVGLGAAALAAGVGLGVTPQMLVAAVTSVLAVGVCYRVRSGPGRPPDRLANTGGALDVGEIIQIDDWQPGGHAQVRYRGSVWRAQPHPDYMAQQTAHQGSSALPTGAWRVADLQGNTLRVMPT